MSKVLLMTAAVIPKYQNEIVRSDLVLRVNDYQKAILSWYKSQLFDKIVFCDNSGLSKEELKSTLCKGSEEISKIIDLIEILTYNDEPDFRYHYGYSELGLVDFAVLNSEALKSSTYFTKCTGRLFYPKYNKLLHHLQQEHKFSVDARSNFLWIKNQQITTQLMIFNTDFYRKELLYAKLEMTPDDYYIERFFYRKLIPYKNDPYCSFRWPIEILPDGVAAHSNKGYSTFKKHIFSMIRSFTRLAFPNFWI